MRRGDPAALPEGVEIPEQDASSDDGADDDEVYYIEPEDEPAEDEDAAQDETEGEEPAAEEEAVAPTGEQELPAAEEEYELGPAGLGDEEREALLLHFDGEQINALEGVFSRLLARHQVRTAAQHQQYRAMGIPDAFAAEYARDLEAADAALSQQGLSAIRGTPQGARTAVLTAIGSRIGQKGNIAAELRKAADLLDGIVPASVARRSAAPAKPAAKVPLPPERKAAPTPASGRGRTLSGAAAATARQSRALRMAQELFEVDADTAKQAMR